MVIQEIRNTLAHNYKYSDVAQYKKWSHAWPKTATIRFLPTQFDLQNNSKRNGNLMISFGSSNSKRPTCFALSARKK